MPKRKKRTVSKKKKDDSPGEVSECDSLDRPPSAKKVAAASSTSHLDDEVDQISTFSSVTLHNTSTSGSTELALLLCNFCSYTAETKTDLGTHMRQHMIKCPHCAFSSLSRVEVSRHCKYEHDKDIEAVTPEVDSSSTECEMDKDPCSACIFCNFMTYSTEHLEKHTASKHPGMLTKSVAKMITKQISADIRKNDYLFYLYISNEGQSGIGPGSSAADKPPEPILIDVSVHKSEDVKPEVKDNPDSKSFQKKLSLLDPKTVLDKFSPSIKEKVGNQETSSSSTLTAPVKVETMYCLTCPYSNVYIEKLKCHTVVQHPVGAAVATYNCTGESVDAEDATFFCVREDCSHSSSDCSNYQRHLLDCCACQTTLKVFEKERLKSTLIFILDHQKKHKFSAVDGFYDFASPLIGISLPQNLKGQLPFRAGNNTSFQTKFERSVSNPKNSVEKTFLERSLQPTSFSSKISTNISETFSSIGARIADSHSSIASEPFFSQQLPSTTPEAHLSGSNKGGHTSMFTNSSDPMNLPVQVHSTSLPNERRQYPAEHSYNTQPSEQLNMHGQINFQQPFHATQKSYPDSPKLNIGWPASNGGEAFQNQVEGGSRFVLQDNTLCNSVSQNKPGSLPLVEHSNMSHSFTSESTSNYTPSFTQSTHNSVNTLHQHETDNNMSNSGPDRMFYGQQEQQSSSAYIPANVDSTSAEAQPQPRILNLLSDSYSILLSDEFRPEKQTLDINLNQSQQTSCNLPSYDHTSSLNAQNQAQVSQSLMSQGHSAMLSTQIEESNFHQPMLDNSQMLTRESPLSFAQASHGSKLLPSIHGNQIVNMPNLSSNSGLQSGQSEAIYSQPASLQQPHVPNFLVAPGVQSSETAPVSQNTTPSFFTSQPRAGQPNVFTSQPSAGQPNVFTSQPCVGQPNVQRVQFTPPKNANTINRFAGASPLSPSIYLSGQSPRHKRSNWTDADMRPRGMMFQAGAPRNMSGPVPAASTTKSQMYTPRSRGNTRPPRMPSSRGRGRMPFNSREDEDDDVIFTAVTRPSLPESQQPLQQHSGRSESRGSPGCTSLLRGQSLLAQNKQRGSGVRMPHPVTPPHQQPPKKFDISKHFEDLACVVNSSADELGNDNDIEIVCVTPGGTDKSNQSKAVDASKFSFCCVHCGKDQGSKNVMKQHMKARHNDSILGAFTNTETGQLLFFCPQLTCEFMTYDEKRLCEHLTKCLEIDRSKPFDFGTAIKNLKSLKIRQLDVRTMGRSQDNPIDLDGQGMKDNFTSSLNDAFGDIVVNASGRHIVRSAVLSNQAHLPTTPQSVAPTNFRAVRNRNTLRNQPPGSYGHGLRQPGFQERPVMVNRFPRPGMTFQQRRHQIPDIRARTRLASPANLRMNSLSSKEFHPRAPSTIEHHPSQRGPPVSRMSTPRIPAVDQNDAVVIVIDVDSPEGGPDETEQDICGVNERSEIPSQTLVRASDIGISEKSASRPYQSIGHPTCTMLKNINQNQDCVSDNSSFDQSSINTSQFNSNNQFHGKDTTLDKRMMSEQSLGELSQVNCNSSNANDENNHISDVDNANIEQNVREYNTNSYSTDVDSNNSFQENVNFSKAAPLNNSVSINTNLNTGTILTSIPASTSLFASEPNSNTPSLLQSSDDEEIVNAVVLKKVFAKVPNMPKNLSWRLVAKFKEYARYRGVKITSDSKVIDEFVSKICYKGSQTDKSTNKNQLLQNQSSISSDGNSNNSLLESSAAASSTDNSEDNQTASEYAKEVIENNRENPLQQQDDVLMERAEHLAVARENSLAQISENDVIATHVILAQTSLEFSPTFASMAKKSLSSAKGQNISQVSEQDQHDFTAKKVDEHQLSYPFKPDVAREVTGNRKNSASNDQIANVIKNVRRSISFFRPEDNSEKKSSDEQLPLKSVTVTSLSDNASLIESSTAVSSDASFNDCVLGETDQQGHHLISNEKSEVGVLSEIEPHQQEESHLINNNNLEIASTSAPLENNTTVVTSSIKDMVFGHPCLEIDVAGKPCEMEDCNKELRTDSQSTVKKVIIQGSPKKIKRFGLIKRPPFPNMDRKTGTLLFKKTKKAIARRPFINKEVVVEDMKDSNVDEAKCSTSEEQFVRRSSRSRKPVNKDYKGDNNEIDDLMSDDDEEYNIDDDDDISDTDSEWKRNISEQPHKKRIKKIVLPPDLTAFDVCTKGKFKCLQCRKVFSKSTYAKSHLIHKHEAGLCAIHLDKSEELKTPCLLLFCPKWCKYTTQSLEAMKNHVDICSNEFLKDGEKFVEINKQFLDVTFKELQCLSLEEILNKTKTRKPKDPSKPKVIKKKKIGDMTAKAPSAIKLSKSFTASETGSVSIPSILSSTSLISVSTAMSNAGNQTATTGRGLLSDIQSNQIHSYTKPQQPQNIFNIIGTLNQSQNPRAVVSEGTNSMAGYSTGPNVISCLNSKPYQMNVTGKQVLAGSSLSHPPVVPHGEKTSSMHDDNIVYVID